ncbi:GspH/FimT family pseudopilin [Aeromonas encheleia]|uniref:GspH/FimT family pseudopilin n=1 Tax=Aeromonas encheleia TaxID=73010 RepID=UPI0022B2A132|nr:GspH/FimT family pseudopilin [Aeromonas encheleia]
MHNRTFAPLGFTLIELMVTIALLSILLTLGVPSFNSLIRNMSLTTQANQFVASVQLARSEAVRRNRNVLLSAQAGNAALHWERGWQVWSDNNGNGSLDGGELIRQFGSFDDNILVSDTAVLRFTSNGFLDGRSPQGHLFSLGPSSCAGGGARDISVSGTGHPSVEEATCL